MTETVLLALIAAMPTVFTGIAAVIAAVFGWINHSRLKIIRVELNGRLTELVAVTAKGSKAEGVKEEKARGDARASELLDKNIKTK